MSVLSPSQEELRPEDLVSTRILKKSKSKVVSDCGMWWIMGQWEDNDSGRLVIVGGW